MSEAIKVVNLKKVYPDGTKALKGINLTIKEGEFCGLMGPSGSGKSSLLHLIAGLDRPTEGNVWVLGREITSMEEDDLAEFRKKNIAFVFQFYYLLEDFSVLENLVIIGQMAGIRDVKRKALDILNFLRLEDKVKHKPSQLSGGQMQRVAIGRALMLEPKILLADEPTGNLDLEEGMRIFELFKHLNQEKGITFVVATHNTELSKFFSRIIRLRDGMIL
ncbi:ABC transporter ATP-binding protein [Hydrogenobacter hydrogenophilus]|uniref:Lipoprotein-releasing system ATP-binding protein n=1 Tax=Hydrogenobacter hydrogenophilus TaxID=35835 RepID=A0A285NU57_9AQUI|nr:ABC transporter ATP-binding protein [Hydrogenobacter hydrogenophilus]SNZ13010.1 lipoprotein-releasing system ATP-binding protein [Hydrogenobacter hydrogenophilus]